MSNTAPESEAPKDKEARFREQMQESQDVIQESADIVATAMSQLDEAVKKLRAYEVPFEELERDQPERSTRRGWFPRP